MLCCRPSSLESLKVKEALPHLFVVPLKSPPYDFAYVILFEFQIYRNANYKKYNHINTDNWNYHHLSCLKSNQCKNTRFLRHIELRSLSCQEIKSILSIKSVKKRLQAHAYIIVFYWLFLVFMFLYVSTLWMPLSCT